MGGNNILIANEVLEIKRQMWFGMSQRGLARANRVSIAAIQAIRQGDTWKYIPWPSGDFGGLPKFREEELRQIKRDQRWNNHNQFEKSVALIESNTERERGVAEAMLARVIDGRAQLNDGMAAVFDKYLPSDWRERLPPLP